MPGLLGTIAGRVTLDIREAVGAYATLRAQNAKTVYAMRGTSEAFIASGRAMVGAGAVMAGAFALAVKEAADFERKLDYFGAVTGTNTKKMQQLSKFTLQLAQDTIYSAGEVADGMIELGKAGVSAQQIMNGIGEAMTNLGAAADIPLIQSGQIITTTVQQYDLAARDAIHVTDLLAGAANASIADISDIGTSLKYVGGVANAAGLTFEDTTTAISLLAKAGIRGSTAGTSLRQMIVSFGGATGPARDALKELGILTADGSNKFYDMQGRLKPLSQVFQVLQDHLDGFNQKEKLAYLRTIFNNRALSAAALLTRDGAKGFRAMYKDMSKVKAADVAHQRLDNLSGDIEILRGNIQTLLVTSGGPFQKTARKWVQSLTKLVQAFADMDPKTQQSIVQFVGLTGAALIAMGTLNILLGTIFKFGAHLLKMGAAISFAVKWLKFLWTWGRLIVFIYGGELAAALGITVGALVAIIAVVAAVIIGLIILYKKSDAFRKIVNEVASAVWNVIKAIGSWFKLLATNPSKAWDQIKNAAKDAWAWIVDAFGKLGGLVKKGLDRAIVAIINWSEQALKWIESLPAKAGAALVSFISWLQSIFTLHNVITALSTALGFIVGIFIKLPFQLLSLALRAVTLVAKAFGTLAPKVLGFLAYMVGFAIGLMLRLALKMVGLATRASIGVIRFMAKLPGRVVSLVGRMVTGALRLMGRIATSLPGLATKAVNGVTNFFAKLPGRVISFMTRMANGIRRIMHALPGIAHDAARGFINGLMNSLAGLPGLVSGLLQRVIDAFLSVVKAGYDAARSVASNLWNGFKDGIGMHSPSFFERAMWQITGTIESETKRLAKQTMHIQKMSRDVAKTNFTPGGWHIPDAPAGAKFMSAASMHAANRNRSQRFLTASQMRGSRTPDHSPSHGTGKKGNQVRIKGKLRLDGSDAYIEGIVEDLLEEDAHWDASTARRRSGRG